MRWYPGKLVEGLAGGIRTRAQLSPEIIGRMRREEQEALFIRKMQYVYRDIASILTLYGNIIHEAGEIYDNLVDVRAANDAAGLRQDSYIEAHRRALLGLVENMLDTLSMLETASKTKHPELGPEEEAEAYKTLVGGVQTRINNLKYPLETLRTKLLGRQ